MFESIITGTDICVIELSISCLFQLSETNHLSSKNFKSNANSLKFHVSGLSTQQRCGFILKAYNLQKGRFK